MSSTPIQNFDDVQILDDTLPELTDTLEKGIIRLAETAWAKSVDARKDCNGIDIIDKIREVEKADRLEHKPVIKNKPKYRSKIYLPWIRKTHLAITAFFVQMMLTGSWNSINGQTPEDKKNAEYMSNVIYYLFENDYTFRKTIVQGIHQCVKKGMTCVKGFWQVIMSYVHNYEPVIDEITGQPQLNKNGNIVFKKVKTPVKKFNDVKLDYVDINDFQFWPTTGRFEETLTIHRTTEKLSTIKARKNRLLKDSYERLEAKINQKDSSLEDIEITLKEVWIYQEHVHGIELNNCVAVIADESIIIEFKNNPYDYGISPFLYTVYNQVEGSLLGTGACFFATDLQDFANLCVNIIADCAKVGAYPIIMAPESLDPSNYISRPGGWWPIKDELFEKDYLPQPFNLDLRNLPLTFESLGFIKQEFSAITIPETIKGIRPERDETATRDRLVQESAETNLQDPAENINEEFLKQLILLIYTLYYQRAKFDDDVLLKIAKLNLEHTKVIQMPVVDAAGQPQLDPQNPDRYLMEEKEILKEDSELLAELGDLIPLERINVQINGYKNNIKKQQTLYNMGMFFESLNKFGNERDIRRVNRDNIIKKMLHNLDLDVNDIVYTDEEAIENELKEFKEAAKVDGMKQLIIQELIAEGILPAPLPQQQSVQSQNGGIQQ